jgi:hypothetical protein
LSVKIDGKGACWHCHHCDWSGPPKGNGSGEAWKREGEWIYEDADGKAYLKVVRYRKPDGDKTYRQYHVEDGQWVKGAPRGPKIPYRLPELNDSDRTEPIWIFEGEKCTEIARRLGLQATCASGGAGKGTKKWAPELNEYFRDRVAWICPDKDKDRKGDDYAAVIAANLYDVAREVRIVNLPTSPDGSLVHVNNIDGRDFEMPSIRDNGEKGEDIEQFIGNGGTVDDLRLLGECSPVWRPQNGIVQGAEGLHEPRQPEPVQLDFVAFWYGDEAVEDARSWLVYGTIAEVGTGLLSGQWGTYKTFAADDLAAAVMTGTPIFGSDIDRRGGVLFYAAEGQSEVDIRIRAAVENRLSNMEAPPFNRAPFAWWTPTKVPLELLDPKSVEQFIARARRVDAEMRARFGVPLVLIIIDTVVTTAGFKKTGDESDPTLCARMMKEGLGMIATSLGLFALGVDHFGKVAETGTRGGSSKEDNSDTVLAALGEKDITGKVTSPRLAVRKVRGGEAGREYAFTTRLVEMGMDRQGRQQTTLVIDWAITSQETTKAKKVKVDPWSKSLRRLRRCIANADGKRMAPYTDGPVVQVVNIEVVKAEFFKTYPADGDTEKKRRDAKKKAWNRSIKDAQDFDLVGIREVDGTQYVWLKEPELPLEKGAA